jgi:hypothetical protein
VISPFRVDVLVTGFVLALPVLVLGLRGDLTPDDVVTRLPWCLAAGWAAVAVVRFASTPPARTKAAPAAPEPVVADEDRAPTA